jgi:hypothetical protein
MAAARVPDALEMRELKYASADDARKDTLARQLVAMDRRAEAILLFERRGDHAVVRELVRWAQDHGDAFLLLQARRLGAQVGADAWRACADVAERKERWLDARQCHLALGGGSPEALAGSAEALQRIAPNLPACLAPPPPPTEE